MGNEIFYNYHVSLLNPSMFPYFCGINTQTCVVAALSLGGAFCCFNMNFFHTALWKMFIIKYISEVFSPVKPSVCVCACVRLMMIKISLSLCVLCVGSRGTGSPPPDTVST